MARKPSEKDFSSEYPHMTTKLRLFLLASVLLVFVAACSSSSAPSKVSGKITYKGDPVTGGTIYFHAFLADGSGNTGASFHYVIKPDGTYIGTEMPAEKMLVSIETESLNPNRPAVKGTVAKAEGAQQQQLMDMMKKVNNVPDSSAQAWGTYVKIPSKYLDPKTSGLEVTLTKGSNNYDINLTD